MIGGKYKGHSSLLLTLMPVYSPQVLYIVFV